MWSWLKFWRRGKPAPKPVAPPNQEVIREGAEQRGEGIQPPQPNAGQQHIDPLHELHVRSPEAEAIARLHLQKYGWCYGKRSFNEKLEDEVILVNDRLLATLLLALRVREGEQVRLWLANGGQFLLFCTQSRAMPIAFKGQGLKGVVNSELVQLSEPTPASGRAMRVKLPAGFASAYRRNYLLLLPNLPAERAPVEEPPALPDAEEGDD